MIDFWSVNRYGTVTTCTAHYNRFIDNEMPSRFDSNGMLIKENISIPTLEALAAEQLQTQAHAKFVFAPEVNVPSLAGFTLGELEVYELVAPQFSINEAVEVCIVDTTTQADFLRIKYEDALAFGEQYAKERDSWLRRVLTTQELTAVIAYLDNEAVGAVELIVQDTTAELDQFFVKPAYQRRGIGSTIQHFIETKYPFHAIFLVADADDTPRDMYQRQGYEHRTTFYELVKQSSSL